MIVLQTLKEIDLAHNQIGKAGVQALAHVLQNKTVITLLVDLSRRK